MFPFCSQSAMCHAMRFSAEHLRFKALVAIDEAAEARDAVPKSFSLRFALAYLYAVSAADRAIFDEFWQAATTSSDGTYMGSLCRLQTLNALMNAICRAVGCERTPDLMAKLRAARGG